MITFSCELCKDKFPLVENSESDTYLLQERKYIFRQQYCFSCLGKIEKVKETAAAKAEAELLEKMLKEKEEK